jgi:nucleoside-diphosphate-sugar epimerase
VVEGRPSRSSGIRAALAGRRILLTGVTGFLGTAVLERLLAEIPDVQLFILARGRGSTSAAARVDQVVRGPAFNQVRETLGADVLRQAVADRIDVLDGDVAGRLPVMPSGLDVVIHCAASVSFDPPIDRAFRTNVLGTAALYEAVAAAGSRPHLVHVSTAYVAGLTKGVIAERALEHGVDWRTESDWALRAAGTVEASSPCAACWT